MINLEIYGLFLIFFILISYPFSDEEYSGILKNTDLNFWLIFLVVLIYLIVLIVEIGLKIRLNFLFIILYYIIMVRDFIRFFLIYEIVFILIIFTILILGYRFERLIAGYIMIFYSFLFSSPTLIILIVFDYRFLIKSWLNYAFIINYFLVGSFMVKFPIFGFHYWLPVAHVEASTVGSMILAGVLLKLGGIGVFYIINYLRFIVKFHWLRIRVPLVMLMILTIRDLKILIAYSSVAHMTIVFYVISLGRIIRKKGILIMMLYHGFISPLMFWLVGILAWWKTRSLIVVKLLRFSYLFLLVIFFLMILNMGFPPFIGFMSEILILKSLVIFPLSLYVIVFRVLFRCYYNIYLFWCFNNLIGIVFKLNFYSLDLFIFLIMILIINLYWKSVLHGILWLCWFINSDYIYCTINIINIINNGKKIFYYKFWSAFNFEENDYF